VIRKGLKGDFASTALLAVAAAIFLCIVSITVWAFASGNARPGSDDRLRNRADSGASGAAGGRILFDRGAHNPAPDEVQAADASGKTAIFADIGLLRARTADSEPITVMVSPFFPYPSDDVAFREELVSKTRAIRSFILDWFAARKIGEIGALGEQSVKQSLIDGINSLLVMGKIDTVYFEEYFVIE